MALVTPSPFVVKDTVVTLGTNDFQMAVTSAVVTPSNSVVTVKGGTPEAVYTDSSNSTWTLELSYLQSYNTNDLALYLFNNEGDPVSFVVEPQAGQLGIAGTVILVPGALGAAIDSYASSTVSLGIKGRPVLIPAA